MAKAKNQQKFIYYFGGGKAEGAAEMKNLLGGKGANLAEMVNLKLPVPAGFTLTTELCTYYYNHKKTYPASLKKELETHLRRLEKEMGATFGDSKNPLLVSVRSGARASMPGMMDTVLNLGLNDTTIQGIIEKTGNDRFAYDAYRRFVSMYGDVVLGMKPQSKDDIDPFEEILDAKKKARGVELDIELNAQDLKELVSEFKAAIKKIRKIDFPEEPMEQLWGAIGAVFGSWNTKRAVIYRKLNNIPSDWGTAVNVQAMVFGNLSNDSGTGVAFTRDAATGKNVFYGEFLMNAQGEDVVAGIRTPLQISKLKRKDKKSYNDLERIRNILEKHYKEMMDIEFTIQEGKLYMLQCRVGKRTAFAAMKIAVDMVKEKLITPVEALRRIEPDQLNQLLRPVFDLDAKKKALGRGAMLTKGLNAGPGAATGKVVFNAEDAEEMAKKGDTVILCRIETSPEDIGGMNAAEGILTQRGGMTSHAALVARQMGKVCVAGAGALIIDYKKRTIKVEDSGLTVKEGDYISLDGTTGEVIKGNIPTKPSEVVRVLVDKDLKPQAAPVYKIYKQIMDWSDKYRKLNVRTNADQPDQCYNAVAFGAEGIGLTRTEHMFFGEGKIGPMREMILASDIDGRRKALKKLLPLQRKDFEGIFKAMDGRPVTIRTIDPPLHEFLPHDTAGQKEMAKEMGVTPKAIKDRVEALHEFNPMLGFRGCRLGMMFPEITEMQAQAIFEAAANIIKKGGKALPEIMIPLVGNVAELKDQEVIVRRVAKEVMDKKGIRFKYLVGTMIEVPRGAITAGEIASVAEFFSFGTNDLTQTTLGVSRDDAGRFLPEYVNREIYNQDPFVSVDQTGVGFLMQHAVTQGRATKKNLKIGICGEHGGDPASVEFCHKIGLNYVSCSPFRIPIARLAASRAAIFEADEKKAARAAARPAVKKTVKKAAKKVAKKTARGKKTTAKKATKK